MSKTTISIAVITMFLSMTIINIPTATAENIPIPHGEDKSLWDLATDPYTRYIGGLFHLTWIMTIAGLIWVQSDSLGLPLIWIIITSASMSALSIPGAGDVFFALVAALTLTIAIIRLVVKRRNI